MAVIYTMELQGYVGAEVQTFYLADRKFNTSPTDTPANQHFMTRVKEAAELEQQLNIDGSATIGYGQWVFANADGKLDLWRNMAVDGRPFIVKRVEDAQGSYSAAPVVMRAVMEDIDLPDAFKTVRVRLYDQLLDLDKPLLTQRYGGTTEESGPTADGDVNIKGALKKRVYGACYNFEADLANPFDRTYQLSDKPGVSAKAYDGGIELTPTSDYPSLAALNAASLAPAEYATCLNASDSVPPGGMFVRLASRPLLQLTFDAVAGATEASRSASAIARQILVDFGIEPSAIDDDTFDDLHEANPAVCGLRITDEATAKGSVERVLRSVGGWILPSEGAKWIVGRIEAPAETADVEIPEWQQIGDVKRIDPNDGNNGIPIYRVVVRYRFLGRSHTEAELDTDITDERREYLLGPNVYREEIAEDLAVKTIHPRAGELIIETQLLTKEDAKAEAERILALRKVKRERWQFTIAEPFGTDINLARTVRLIMSRYLTEGKNFIVLRRVRQYAKRKNIFDVWG